MNPIVQKQIKHVVVLMLENNSFDRLLGALQRSKPQLEGISTISQRSNLVSNLAFTQSPYSADQRTLPGFDPGHEALDAKRQMGQYDPILDAHPMDGYAQDAYNQYPHASVGDRIDHAQWVMNYFPYHPGSEAPEPLPVLRTLASNYVICDHWFGSMPGPTLPNRFFATCGTAFGEVLMPAQANWVDITLALGLMSKTKTEESIFSLCKSNGVSAQVYCSGALPFSAFVNEVEVPEVKSMASFVDEALAGQLPQFSWIEPDYAFLGGWGDSQHPPSDPSLGEALIQQVYQALRRSPQWEHTLFVLNYDESGGFYDHVSPPAAVAPDERNAKSFQRLGPRVPAVLISPCLKPGALDPTVYDHTSLLAFVCDLFGLPRSSLRQRVLQAQHFGNHPDIWCEPDTGSSVVIPAPRIYTQGEPPVSRWQALGELMERALDEHAAGKRISGVLGGLQTAAAKLLHGLR